ncbi:MAG TPA: hypothetical protein V6D23_02950 [Candidatus Obscuribacterales bacterium]
MSPLKIYLSASISNAHNNSHLAEQFDPARFTIYLPQQIVSDQLNHSQFPLQVYQQCIDMMNASDLGLVLFDAFGRDCAWECGWYSARADKALIAYVEAGSIFMRDWMVKGGLDALITPNERLYEVCRQNPILQHKRLELIEDIAGLPAAIEKVYGEWKRD